MKFSDETLMAYADGELDEDTHAAVAAAIATDGQIAARIEHYRAQRKHLHAAFDGVLDEPIPDRLLNAVRSGPSRSSADIVNLAQARSEKNARTQRAWSWREWGAIAASLIVGLVFGQRGWRDSHEAMIATTATGVAARGTLDRALSEQLASAAASSSPVRMGVSFRAKSGEYCRTFALPRDGNIAGVACRNDGQWRIQTLAQSASPPDQSEYRAAGAAMPAAVLKAVEDSIEGDALDAKAEAAAKARGWK